MEYWRTKRLEPRVIRLIRKGTIAFSDLIQASTVAHSRIEELTSGGDLEDRVAALEIGLGKFIAEPKSQRRSLGAWSSLRRVDRRPVSTIRRPS